MSEGKRPPGVMLYFAEMRTILALMTDEERGQTLAAILDYAGNNECGWTGSRKEN